MFEAFRSPCINHKWRSKGLEHPCYPPFWVKNCREFDADKGMSATGKNLLWFYFIGFIQYSGLTEFRCVLIWWDRVRGVSGYLHALPNQSDLNIWWLQMFTVLGWFVMSLTGWIPFKECPTSDYDLVPLGASATSFCAPSGQWIDVDVCECISTPQTWNGKRIGIG